MSRNKIGRSCYVRVGQDRSLENRRTKTWCSCRCSWRIEISDIKKMGEISVSPSGEVGRSFELMVGDKKWEGGGKIMRNPCLSRLLNNTDKQPVYSFVDEIQLCSMKNRNLKIARWLLIEEKFHRMQIIVFYFLFLTYIPCIFVYFPIKIYLIIFIEISNLWIWIYRLSMEIVRAIIVRASLFSFDCFQATISSSPPWTNPQNQPNTYSTQLCRPITYAHG